MLGDDQTQRPNIRTTLDLLRRRWKAMVPFLLLPVAVLAFFVAVTRPISARMEYAAEGALAEGMNRPNRDWIDRSLGDAEVGVLWTGNTSRFSVWQNELFSRAVGDIYELGPPMDGGLPAKRLELDRRTGRLRGGGGEPFVLTDGAATPFGRLVEADRKRNVFLYEVAQPLRQAALVEGLHSNDTWSGPVVTYTRFACRGGAVTVALQSDPHLYTAPSTVRVRGTTLRTSVPPDGRAHTLTVPLRPRAGTCTAVFEISPTRVPGHGDLRTLGLHFNSFRYRP